MTINTVDLFITVPSKAILFKVTTPMVLGVYTRAMCIRAARLVHKHYNAPCTVRLVNAPRAPAVCTITK